MKSENKSEMNKIPTWSRRELLGTAAAAISPFCLPSSASAVTLKIRVKDRMNVACIGLGGQCSANT